MKKLFNLLLVSFLILSLTECSKKESEIPNENNVSNDIESSSNESNAVVDNKNENKNSSDDKEVLDNNQSNNITTNNNEPTKNNISTHTHVWFEVYEIVKHEEIIGEYTNFRIPFLGFVVGFARSTFGYLLLVVLLQFI